MATNCLRGEEALPTRRQEFLPLAKGENQRMTRMLLSWSGFSRGMLVFLTTDFTDYTDSSLTEWACAWPPGGLVFGPRMARMVTNLLSTDFTDDTDSCKSLHSCLPPGCLLFDHRLHGLHGFFSHGTIASTACDYLFHLCHLLIFSPTDCTDILR